MLFVYDYSHSIDAIINLEYEWNMQLDIPGRCYSSDCDARGSVFDFICQTMPFKCALNFLLLKVTGDAIFVIYFYDGIVKA